MPLRLEIKRKFAQRTERVKSVDIHPTEPWILASLYSGTVCIWDYQSQLELDKCSSMYMQWLTHIHNPNDCGNEAGFELTHLDCLDQSVFMAFSGRSLYLRAL